MAENDYFIRTNDVEAAEMLRKLAEADMRTIGNEVAWLIRAEWARRYSSPNPNVTLEEAVKAAQGN